MAPRISKTGFGFLLTTSAIPLVAYSQVYLTEDQALQAIFPGEKFVRKILELSKNDIQTIEEKSNERVRNTSVVAWVNAIGNVILVDQALGKHEFITYAVGITSKKQVKNIEILEYRETYGYQVRQEDWRKQFIGKDATATLKLNKDIVNISGATLSSSHITGGVRRLLQTYETIKERL